MITESGDDDSGIAPEEAFGLLGNETRISILQTLWDAFESGKGDNELSYSELFEAVDYDDSGNFSYHLEKLTGPFVRKSTRGYELKQTGINVVHHVYVQDVATALRSVAESGTPGEAYNVGTRHLVTLDQRLDHIATALDTEVTPVHASERELAEFDLSPTDFPLVRQIPVLVDTSKLGALDWKSTPHQEAIRRTVDDHLESDRTGRHHGPDRAVEARAIDVLSIG